MRRALAVAVCLLAALVLVHAQQQPQQPTFRGGVDIAAAPIGSQSAAPVPSAPPAPAAPAADVTALMARVATYVANYGEQMSVVIGVEHYAQWLQREDSSVGSQSMPGMSISRPFQRQLVAEFALVRNRTDWDGYRNVYEVDGKRVADADDRLRKLFVETPATAVEQSRRIAAESSRYNMGALQRNFNIPTVALFFLSATSQARFRFAKDKDDDVGGVRVWKIRYEEVQKPTIIRTSSGKDMPVKGEVWVDPVDGRVMKTHMQIDSEVEYSTSGGGRRRAKTNASMTVTYAVDAKLGLLLPAEMLENYEAPMRSAFTGEDVMSKVNCRATYSDFKRFETSGRMVAPK